MGRFKIKIRSADSWFSKFIRTRDHWHCQRCGRSFVKGDQYLQNMHFITRGNESTRFDPENCAAGCVGCHDWLGKNPHEHCAFFLKRLGQERYDALILRSHIPHKKDDAMVVIWCKEAIREIENDWTE